MLLILAIFISWGLMGYSVYKKIKLEKEINDFISGSIQKRHDMNVAANKAGMNVNDLYDLFKD